MLEAPRSIEFVSDALNATREGARKISRLRLRKFWCPVTNHWIPRCKKAAVRIDPFVMIHLAEERETSRRSTSQDRENH